MGFQDLSPKALNAMRSDALNHSPLNHDIYPLSVQERVFDAQRTQRTWAYS